MKKIELIFKTLLFVMLPMMLWACGDKENNEPGQPNTPVVPKSYQMKLSIDLSQEAIDNYNVFLNYTNEKGEIVKESVTSTEIRKVVNAQSLTTALGYKIYVTAKEGIDMSDGKPFQFKYDDTQTAFVLSGDQNKLLASKYGHHGQVYNIKDIDRYNYLAQKGTIAEYAYIPQGSVLVDATIEW